MKITPLEIRQKTFEKVFRGIDRDEVNAFLTTLSQEWEKLLDENKELRIKLEGAEREVEKLREVESSLFKTLKTAEDTGANMIDQAEKTAQLHMRETQLNADAILSDAKKIAKDTIEEAESHSRSVVEDMEENIKNLMQIFRTLENYRDDVISDIKNVAQEAMDKSVRAEKQRKQFDLDDELFRAKELSAQYKMKKTISRNQNPIVEDSAPKEQPVENRRVEKKQVATQKQTIKENKNQSFFDGIE